MSIQPDLSARPEVEYPESDGRPMADNTRQFRWIATLQGNLDALFRDDPDVFVAGDLLWYPVEGDNTIRTAPDVMVAFGRPKGDRGSYLQWQEGGIPPQVVFEVLSPGNRASDMKRKFEFYQRFGVDEYYIINPDTNRADGWIRSGKELKRVPELADWVSPRLGIRFEWKNEELLVNRPDGTRFATYLELAEQVENERREREHERQRADRLAEQLRQLGIEPEN